LNPLVARVREAREVDRVAVGRDGRLVVAELVVRREGQLAGDEVPIGRRRATCQWRNEARSQDGRRLQKEAAAGHGVHGVVLLFFTPSRRGLGRGAASTWVANPPNTSRLSHCQLFSVGVNAGPSPPRPFSRLRLSISWSAAHGERDSGPRTSWCRDAEGAPRNRLSPFFLQCLPALGNVVA